MAWNIPKFRLNFVLSVYETELDSIKSSLTEFGDQVQVLLLPHENAQEATQYSVELFTEDPTGVFDLCSQFGRIRSIKITEEGK